MNTKQVATNANKNRISKRIIYTEPMLK